MVGSSVLPKCMSSKLTNSKVKQLRGETTREKSHGGETTNTEMVKGRNNLDIPERGPG